ncbi:unnamed protein product [Rhizophagus irregularis]|nr:unnamed protein product [Rhizophagus irregularis]
MTFRHILNNNVEQRLIVPVQRNKTKNLLRDYFCKLHINTLSKRCYTYSVTSLNPKYKFKIMVHTVPNDTSFCLRMKHSIFTTFNLLGFHWRNYLKYSKSQE